MYEEKSELIEALLAREPIAPSEFGFSPHEADPCFQTSLERLVEDDFRRRSGYGGAKARFTRTSPRPCATWRGTSSSGASKSTCRATSATRKGCGPISPIRYRWSEKQKVFTRTNPLDFARDWSRKHRSHLTADLDQALVLIGACVDGSGINASDTLKNDNFKPHVAPRALLEWLRKNGPDQTNRNAASRCGSIFTTRQAGQAPKPQQGSLFKEYEL